jgi:hypothetical protein
MKHLISYFTILLLAIFMVVIIRHQEPKVSLKLITVSKYYAYLYTTEQKISIPIYINSGNHPLSDQDSYQHTYLSNEEESKKLEVSLFALEKFGTETYLNDEYHIYHLIFTMPYLAHDYYIEDCYLNITLANDQGINVYIGKMSLLYLESDSSLFDWQSLSGIKKENSFLSRLSEIHVNFFESIETIESIQLGMDLEVTFKEEQNKLIIYIPFESYLLDNVPIIITFSNTEKQGIMNFKYIVDYHILKESGPLIHTYALD